jgi:hypothetical protein
MQTLHLESGGLLATERFQLTGRDRPGTKQVNLLAWNSDPDQATKSSAACPKPSVCGQASQVPADIADSGLSGK